jgi:phage baseplate assembly protein W
MGRRNDRHMTNVVDQWVGNGPRFPLRPDPVTKRFEYVDGMELIRQSVAAILDTEPGERIMLPTFGCGLRRYLMEPNTLSTRTSMQQDIATALQQWEPRITGVNVAVTPGDDPSLVWIEIAYVRRADRRPDNLVYPFYLK